MVVVCTRTSSCLAVAGKVKHSLKGLVLPSRAFTDLSAGENRKMKGEDDEVLKCSLSGGMWYVPWPKHGMEAKQ